MAIKGREGGGGSGKEGGTQERLFRGVAFWAESGNGEQGEGRVINHNACSVVSLTSQADRRVKDLELLRLRSSNPPLNQSIKLESTPWPTKS